MNHLVSLNEHLYDFVCKLKFTNSRLLHINMQVGFNNEKVIK